VHTQGNVAYGYSTIAGIAGNNKSALGNQGFPTALGAGTGQITITAPAASSLTSDWYAITAVGNPSGDANPCAVMGVSFQSDLIVANEGN
jgi:hypothetical protein